MVLAVKKDDPKGFLHRSHLKGGLNARVQLENTPRAPAKRKTGVSRRRLVTRPTLGTMTALHPNGQGTDHFRDS